VRILLRLRDILSLEQRGHELSPQAEAARAEIINLVNNFYYEKLTGVPQIQEYIEKLADAGCAALPPRGMIETTKRGRRASCRACTSSQPVHPGGDARAGAAWLCQASSEKRHVPEQPPEFGCSLPPRDRMPANRKGRTCPTTLLIRPCCAQTATQSGR
jgi:hypothetical protein